MARATLTLALVAFSLAACEDDIDVRDRAGTVDSIGPALFAPDAVVVDGELTDAVVITYSTWDPEGGDLVVLADFAIGEGEGEFQPIEWVGGRIERVFSEHAQSTSQVLVWPVGEEYEVDQQVTVRLAVEGRESLPATLGPFVPAELAVDPAPRPVEDAGSDADAGGDADPGDAAMDSSADAPADTGAAADAPDA